MDVKHFLKIVLFCKYADNICIKTKTFYFLIAVCCRSISRVDNVDSRKGKTYQDWRRSKFHTVEHACFLDEKFERVTLDYCFRGELAVVLNAGSPTTFLFRLDIVSRNGSHARSAIRMWYVRRRIKMRKKKQGGSERKGRVVSRRVHLRSLTCN